MRAWTRREILAAASVGLPTCAAAATAPVRVAALDWTLAATTLALGVMPVGIAEQSLYRNWVGTPAISAGIAELGLRTVPSFETLTVLRPDLILLNTLNAGIRNRLETIAPTFTNTIFTADRTPLDRGRIVTRALAARLGHAADAEALIGATEARIIAARVRLAGLSPRPLLPLNLLDAQHVCLYGTGSLYADVLAALGLSSAFAGSTSVWGSATLGIGALAKLPPCDLLVVAPVPAPAQHMMARPGLWTSLLAAKDIRVHHLPPAWAFGDLSAAAGFAESVVDVLAPAALRFGAHS